jgi:hypothetical protein
MFETAAVIYFEMNRSSPLHGFSTKWTKLMTRPAARPKQSGADSAVARPLVGVGGFAGCMVLAAARLRASGMEIIAMARGQRKLSS